MDIHSTSPERINWNLPIEEQRLNGLQAISKARNMEFPITIDDANIKF